MITKTHTHAHCYSFGLVPAVSVATRLTLMPNTSVNISFPISTRGRALKLMNPPNLLQIIITNSVGKFGFTAEIPLNILFTDDGKMGKYEAHCIKKLNLNSLMNLESILLYTQSMLIFLLNGIGSVESVTRLHFL